MNIRLIALWLIDYSVPDSASVLCVFMERMLQRNLTPYQSARIVFDVLISNLSCSSLLFGVSAKAGLPCNASEVDSNIYVNISLGKG